MAQSIELVGVVYNGEKGVYGDFVHMIEQPEHKDDFFIFSENVYDMYKKTEAGAGTAALRPWTVQREDDNRIYAGGIPSGWSSGAGGFNAFTVYVKNAIDTAMTRLEFTIKQEIQTRPIERIFYSADKDNPNLIGTGIFAKTIHPTVVKYISTKLHQLVGRIELQSATSEHQLKKQENATLLLAQVYRQNAAQAAQLRVKNDEIKELNDKVKALEQSRKRTRAQGQTTMAGAMGAANPMLARHFSTAHQSKLTG
jgi:hypothetical protein